MDFINCLNANSGAITGISTFVLACVTIYYAWVTRQMRIDAQTPDIAIRLLSSTNEHDNLVAQLCVENIGSGPARGVQFHDVPPIQIQLAFIKDFPLIRYGISYLVPGEKKTIDLGSEYELNLNELEHKITVTYQDSRKKEYKKCFPLDFRSLWGEDVPLVC